MNHVQSHNVGMQQVPQRLAESLPELIEQIGNELAVLEKNIDQARDFADRLHGGHPRDASALKQAQPEPGALLVRLRSRLTWLENLNQDISRELSRIGAGL